MSGALHIKKFLAHQCAGMSYKEVFVYYNVRVYGLPV